MSFLCVFCEFQHGLVQFSFSLMAVPGSLDQPCFGCFGLVQSHQKKKIFRKICPGPTERILSQLQREKQTCAAVQYASQGNLVDCQMLNSVKSTRVQCKIFLPHNCLACLLPFEEFLSILFFQFFCRVHTQGG